MVLDGSIALNSALMLEKASNRQCRAFKMCPSVCLPTEDRLSVCASQTASLALVLLRSFRTTLNLFLSSFFLDLGTGDFWIIASFFRATHDKTHKVVPNTIICERSLSMHCNLFVNLNLLMIIHAFPFIIPLTSDPLLWSQTIQATWNLNPNVCPTDAVNKRSSEKRGKSRKRSNEKRKRTDRINKRKRHGKLLLSLQIETRRKHCKA